MDVQKDHIETRREGVGCERSWELSGEGAGSQRVGDMGSRRWGLACHLWARIKASRKGQPLGASTGHAELQLPARHLPA